MHSLHKYQDKEDFAEFDLAKIMEQALPAVYAASELAMEKFRMLGSLKVESKSQNDFVSEADKEVEDLLRDKLNGMFPDFIVFGEENAAKDRESLSVSRCVWVIDPIDGTSSFLSGLKSWCISVALCIDNIPVIGIISAPATGDLYTARKGGGAKLNDRPIHVSENEFLKFAFGHSDRVPCDEVLKVLQTAISQNIGLYCNGSGALMLAEVAAGRLSGYYETHHNSWDSAAGIRLVLEAGGTVLDFDPENYISEGKPSIVGTDNIFKKIFPEL